MKLSKATWLLLLMMGSAHAQLYKSVAPDGTVSYSDTPPPATSGVKVERKSISSGPSTADLPYSVAQPTRNNPVTLYTMTNCSACDSGRKLLASRGVPFTEKTVATGADLDVLRKVSGGDKLPVIIVGHTKQVSYESGQWNELLNAAGYPASNNLPKSYSNPPPESAAPAPQKAEPAASAPPPVEKKESVPTLPPAKGNAPPGFQF